MKKNLVIILLLVISLSFCHSARAQDKEEVMDHALVLAQSMKKSGIDLDNEYQLIYKAIMSEEKAAEEKEKEKAIEVTQTVESYARFMPSSDVEVMPGEVKVSEAFFEYGFETKVFGKLPVKFSLASKYIGLENTTAVPLPAHLTGISTGIEFTLPFFTLDKTYMRIELNPSFYTDDWSFDTSSFRMPTYIYGIYLPNDKWTFVLGAAVFPDYKEEVLPIIGFIYKPNDKLTFNITSKRPNITYKLNDKIGLFVEGGGTRDEFEVKRASQENVVLLYKETHAGAGLKYRFNEFIQSSFTVGGVFNRTIKYIDGQGKVNVDGGLYTELRLNARF